MEIHQTDPHFFEHLPGITDGGPDGLSWLTGTYISIDAISRLVATDISIDGRRDRTQPIGAPHPNIWDDCRYISERSILRILASQLPTLMLDTAWVNLVEALPNCKDVIQTEIRRQNKKKKSMALGPETIAKLEEACSGPMSNWVENLRVLNISADNDDNSATDRRLTRTAQG